MKILLLGPYPPPQGGIQTHLVGLRKYLRQQGIPSYVINLTRHHGIEGEGVYYPRLASQVLRLLFRLPYNIAHIHIGGDLSPRLLGLSFITGVLPAKRVVLTFHSGGYPSSRLGMNTHPRTPRAIILRRFDGLIGVNQQIVDFYRKCGVSDAKIRLIPPFMQTEIPQGTTLPPALDQFFNVHHPIILSVGLLEPEYELVRQIRVIGQVRKNFSHAGLVIIGSGSLEHQLKELIANSPENDHILLAGDVPHAETLLAIQRCTLLLRTTLYDGDALSVREALQLGTPVVATDNGMRPKGVQLITPSDPAALRDAVEICLRGGKRRPVIGSFGQQNMRAVVEFYQDVLSGTVSMQAERSKFLFRHTGE